MKRQLAVAGAAIVTASTAIAHAQAPPAVDESAAHALDALVVDEAHSQRDQRRFGAFAVMGFGVGFGAVGGLTLAFPDALGHDRSIGQLAGGMMLGVSGLSFLLGAIQLAVHTPMEDLADEYAIILADPSLSAKRLDKEESKLRALAARERGQRVVSGALTIAAGSLAAGSGITLASFANWDPAVKWSYGVAIGALGGLDVMLGIWAIVYRRDPAERLSRIWSLGTGRAPLDVSFAPTNGGGSMALQGAF